MDKSKIRNPAAPATTALFILLLVSSYNFVFAGESAKLTILHTNDMHGRYLPSKATWLDREPDIGGFEALSYYVKRERDRAGYSLLLDAGDFMPGRVWRRTGGHDEPDRV